MTEEEWLTATDPEPMLAYLDGKASERKLRLFGVACCRSSRHLRDDAEAMARLEVVSRYADGDTCEAQMRRVATGSEELAAEGVGPMGPEFGTEEWWDYTARCNTHEAVAHLAGLGVPDSSFVSVIQDVVGSVDFLSRPPLDWRTPLRDIFGNPFRLIAFDPAWRSEAAIGLASGIYEERAFERMPILADALEEAGCEDADILTHCREPGTHVRGCWVVDLVLGKS